MEAVEIQDILKKNYSVGELLPGHNYLFVCNISSISRSNMARLSSLLKDKMGVNAVIVGLKPSEAKLYEIVNG